ncbi:MAG: dTDP-4-amino-4,6-dideoxygalactose transaminase [Betaproteobacteria bacterium RIFCSPLOWO2_02_FULL_62_17]|nr:MAG: dTDP-4-amino-4,6-dideoxygalactose transaminase [Betaproteobacteria bacterium RIFCSPLOWO2_02_FULL_62_17]
MRIPFNKPYMTGGEIANILQAHANRQLAGDGEFTRRCCRWLEERTGSARALLTHSCTAALEMAAILADFQPGDEIIMPSFTFVSTANAFVLRGGVPVFVDIRPDTLNIDENLIEAAITARTRAITVVHYAGVACEMNAIMALAGRHGLLVIEDAAQGLMSDYRGRPLGSIGHLGAISFHETKNVISGEGGALLINRPELIARAEIVREKGTNRSRFLRGEIDKYTWEDIGSSYLPSELIAAFLWAQMGDADGITRRRLDLWQSYHAALQAQEEAGRMRRPVIPSGCRHNAHMYYLLLRNETARAAFIARLGQRGVGAVSHYVPLHDSTMGRRCARAHGDMMHTVQAANRLVRLPLWLGLEEHMNEVLEQVGLALGQA